MMGDTKTTLLSNGQRGALDYFWEHLGLGQVFELALPATIFNSAELVALFDEYAPFPEAARIAGEPAGTDGRFRQQRKGDSAEEALCYSGSVSRSPLDGRSDSELGHQTIK